MKIAEKWYRKRQKVANNRLGLWYVAIAVGLLLLFVSACSISPVDANKLIDGPTHRYNLTCSDATQIKYCEGHSPSFLKCVCVLRRDIG